MRCDGSCLGCVECSRFSSCPVCVRGGRRDSHAAVARAVLWGKPSGTITVSPSCVGRRDGKDPILGSRRVGFRSATVGTYAASRTRTAASGGATACVSEKTIPQRWVDATERILGSGRVPFRYRRHVDVHLHAAVPRVRRRAEVRPRVSLKRRSHSVFRNTSPSKLCQRE